MSEKLCLNCGKPAISSPGKVDLCPECLRLSGEAPSRGVRFEPKPEPEPPPDAPSR